MSTSRHSGKKDPFKANMAVIVRAYSTQNVASPISDMSLRSSSSGRILPRPRDFD